MMTKEEHINHWLKTADEDMKTMYLLYKEKKYVHALFFGHLHLEKYCKALWIKNNESNTPPKIHNLLTILERANVTVEEDKKIFLLKLNQYQLEGRYPSDWDKLWKITNGSLTTNYVETIKEISKCILKKLQ